MQGHLARALGYITGSLRCSPWRLWHLYDEPKVDPLHHPVVVAPSVCWQEKVSCFNSADTHKAFSHLQEERGSLPLSEPPWVWELRKPAYNSGTIVEIFFSWFLSQNKFFLLFCDFCRNCLVMTAGSKSLNGSPRILGVKTGHHSKWTISLHQSIQSLHGRVKASEDPGH